MQKFSFKLAKIHFLIVGVLNERLDRPIKVAC